jgi:hypothetical protein
VKADMGRVRPFARQDIPQVAELHRTVFAPVGPAPEPAAYERYFSEVFLDNPWRDPRLPSRVFQEDDGRISGFLGVVPRRMAIDGRPLLAAICSQFIVHPARRGLVGLQLLKTVFEGPQDLSITDEANDGTRRIWEGRGGATAFLHSMRWFQPLRVGRLATSVLAHRKWMSPLVAAARPVAAIGDAVGARLFRCALQPADPHVTGESLDEATLLSGVSKLAGDRSIRPDYDARSLGWLLKRASQMKREGRLVGTAVKRGGEILGWYLYYAKKGHVGEVLQIAATRRTIADVLSHLRYSAWMQGATGLAGRLEPAFTDELLSGCVLSRGRGPWMLVHSKQTSLVDAIQRGDTFLSRLDGEWCLRFQS